MNAHDRFLEQPYADADKRQAEFDMRIDLIKDALWESMASPLTAQKLADDWELLVNIVGEILMQVAYAKSHPEECAWCMAQVIELVNRKLFLVATHQAEHKPAEDEIEHARRMA